MTNRTAALHLCFIGFGEAGQALAAGLREAGLTQMSAWDILFPRREGQKLRQAAAATGVGVRRSAADAAREADVVISAVTAASSFEAAQSAAPHLHGRPFFLDINSVSPGRKQKTARLLGDKARYVDAAVMGPIHPARHRTPMLLAGPDAEAAAPLLAGWDMRAAIAGGEVGAAAAIKMVRSVMIKGLEALTLECFLAAQRAGVADEVVASLSKSFPTLDWPTIIDYNLERMATHGIRRAAEMEEVAATLRELGVEPLMTRATAEREREMGMLGKQPAVGRAKTQGGAAMLDAISACASDVSTVERAVERTRA